MKSWNVLLFLLSFFSTAAFSQETRKVLFLGNSYTYVNDLPQIISQLAASTGDVLIYDSNLIGGYTLQNHFESTVSKDKILSDDWDYIVLQEQSQLPAFQVPSAFMNGFSNLNDFISQNQTCAQITSFMTWGYQNGDTQNCPITPSVCSYEGMQALLTDRYMNISSIYESEVTPVGIVWKYIRENHPTINLYHSDGSHPSVAGSYLAACCFYTSLFRKDPSFITDNYGLDPSVAAILRTAVTTLVFNQQADWYIGQYVPNSNFTYVIGNGSNEVLINQNNPTFRDSFVWDFGDGTTSTATIPIHSYAADGTYTIKLTSHKCYLGQDIESVFERMVTFCPHTNTIYPNLILCPNVPGTVWTQPADSYQWCDDFGNPISGATNQYLEVFGGYSYSVLTTINGCTERSPQIFVDSPVGGIDGEDPCPLGIIDNQKFEVLLAPNPSQDIISIRTDKEIKTVAVYDLLGKEIPFNQVSPEVIDLSALANGMYVIKFVSKDDETFIRKVVKN